METSSHLARRRLHLSASQRFGTRGMSMLTSNTFGIKQEKERERRRALLYCSALLIVIIVIGVVVVLLGVGGSFERNEDHGVGNTQETFQDIPYDGFNHNPVHPDWGREDGHMLDLLPLAYADGVGALSGPNRPNPSSVSQISMSGPTGFGSYRNVTALCVFFGQQVVEEVLDAQLPGCPREYINIPVDKTQGLHNPGDGDFFVLNRNRYDLTTGHKPGVPRVHLNEITPWIDGGLFYGTKKAWSDALRSFKDGKLASVNDEGLYPAYNDIVLPIVNPPPPRDHHIKPVQRFFRTGNPRTNENPMLLTMAIIWFRYHNYWADRLKVEHPDWDDEKLYTRARVWTIATHQHMVTNKWLPAFASVNLDPYTAWNPNINPQISTIFQSAAQRFGHTMVVPGIFRRNKSCVFRNTSEATGGPEGAGFPGLRTCNTFFNPQEAVLETGIDEIIMGLASQLAEREDHIITEDLRGFVFGGLDNARRDLMAINIQRGRDNGLPDYNTARIAFGLPPVTAFIDLIPSEPAIAAKLEQLYHGDINDVDIWVGGILDSGMTGPGALFKAVLKDQYMRIRDGDWYWFKNPLNGLFNDSEIAEIEATEFSDVIVRVTDITYADIQKDVFHFQEGDPCPQPFMLSQFILQNCTQNQGYDYYEGSYGTIELIIFSVIGFIIVCLVARQGIVRFRPTEPIGVAKEEPQFLPAATALNGKDGMVHRILRIAHNKEKGTGIVSFETVPLYVRMADGALVFFRPRSLEWDCTSCKARNPLSDVDCRGCGHKANLVIARMEQVQFRRWYQEIERVVPFRSMNINGSQGCELVIQMKEDAAPDLRFAFDSPAEMGDFLDEIQASAKPIVNNPNFIIHPDTAETYETKFVNRVRPEEARKELIDKFEELAYESCSVLPRIISVTPTHVQTGTIINIAGHGFSHGATLISFGDVDVDCCSKSVNHKSDQELQVECPVLAAGPVRLAVTNCAGTTVFAGEITATGVAWTSPGGETMDEKRRDAGEMLSQQRRATMLDDLENCDIKSNLEKVYASAKTRYEQLNQETKVGFMMQTEFNTVFSQKYSDNEFVNRLWQLAKSFSRAPESGMEKPDTLCFPSFVTLLVCWTTPCVSVRTDCLWNVFCEKPDDTSISRARLTQMLIAMVHAGPKVKLTEQAASDLISSICQMVSIDPELQRFSNTEFKTLFWALIKTDLEILNADQTSGPIRPSYFGAAYRYLQTNRGSVWLLILLYLVQATLFAMRFYDYSYLREHRGLRQICGKGVSITRAAASEMMMTLGLLFLTSCKNLITVLRESSIGKSIQLDNVQKWHKHVAYNFLVWCCVHCIGHLFNFRNISSQPPADTVCTFPEVYHSSNVLTHYSYWVWETPTGLSGYGLILAVIMMGVFSTASMRANAHRAFEIFHHLSYVIVALVALHGSLGLVQRPEFHWYIMGPGIVYLLDKVYTFSRRGQAFAASGSIVQPFRDSRSPQGVVRLTFRPPPGFRFSAGQSVNICCPELGGEYHPFSISSSPMQSQDSISMHIRVVGDWTSQLARLVEKKSKYVAASPHRRIQLFFDGPYGDCTQHWNRYQVAVMLCGGIGVTPFASILTEMAQRISNGANLPFYKMYFVWVERTHENWNWMLQAIRQLEIVDQLAVNKKIKERPVMAGKQLESYKRLESKFQALLCLTAVSRKVDLRLALIRAVNHTLQQRDQSNILGIRGNMYYGRPDLTQILTEIVSEVSLQNAERHSRQETVIRNIGVFSCGGTSFVDGADIAISKANGQKGDVKLVHHHL